VLLTKLQEDVLRFSGVTDHIRCCMRAALMAGKAGFDVASPAESSDDFMMQGRRLAAICEGFVANAGVLPSAAVAASQWENAA
jgi:hypothetical protein